MWSVREIQTWRTPGTKKPENPAKKLLSSYLAAIRERDGLIDEINRHYARAVSCTSHISPIPTGGNAAYDRTSESIADMLDAQDRLKLAIGKLNATVDRIMTLWETMEDGKQKELLLYRYIRGLKWEDIQDVMGYERSQIYVIHGKALLSFNKLMQNS